MEKIINRKSGKTEWFVFVGANLEKGGKGKEINKGDRFWGSKSLRSFANPATTSTC